MYRRVLVILTTFLTAACLTACGSAVKVGTSLPATTSAPTTTVPVSTTVSPQVRRAQATNLQIEDFPPDTGWKATDDEPGQGLDIDRLWTELSQCAGITVPSDVTVKSPTFLRGLATQARSRVTYTPSGATLVPLLSGSRVQSCVNTAFAADVKRSAPEGATPGPVTVKVVPPTPTLAAKADGSTYKVTVTLTLGDTPETAPNGQKAQGPIGGSSQLQIPLFQDFYVLVTPTATVQLWFLNPGSDFPPELERTLVDKVLGRV